jgi:hypothetical protein
MRFAEHMLLEANNYKLVPYNRCDSEGRRCALGLVEGNQWNMTALYKGRLGMAEQKYPWLDISTFMEMPCNCEQPAYRFPSDVLERPYRAASVIVHLFNEHVMREHGGGQANPEAEPWTLERLADWIEAVDPTQREEISAEVAVDQTELILSDHSDHLDHVAV